jgi:uroporphyrinogen decarboxylase
MKLLSERENFLLAVSRQEPQWVPYSIWLAPDLEERYKAHIGEREFGRRFSMPWVNLGGVRWQRTRPRPTWEDFKKYYEGEDIPDGVEPNGYGVIRVPGSFYHFTHMLNPMRRLTTAQEVYDYPWPEEPPYEDPAYIRQLKEKVDAVKATGKAALAGSGGLFELGWSLRGNDKMLEDFVTDGEVSEAILDILCQRAVGSARAAALAGTDVLGAGDDVGMQTGLMMSPATWRKWLKPRTEAIFRAAKEVTPDIVIRYHTDGNVESILPDFIEIGLDCLNPVQPECMNPKSLKARYGDRLSFWGTIGVQSVFPWGTPDELRANVRDMIETVGKGGGLVVGPTHTVEPEVPIGNLDAFFEAVWDFGGYRKLGLV